MSAASHNSYATGFPPSPVRVEPLADCANARAGGHLAPGARAPAAPGVLSDKEATIQAMRDAYAQGMNMRQACEAVGITIPRALYFSGKYGVKPSADAIARTRGRRITDDGKGERNARIVAAVKRGESTSVIAAAEGINASSVRRIACEARKTKPKKAPLFTKEQDATMLRMRSEGALLRTIAEKMGVKVSQIESRVRYLRGRERFGRLKEKRRDVRLPMVAREHAQAAMRRCLCGCNRMFPSTGPGNRIRPECAEVFNNRHTGAV